MTKWYSSLEGDKYGIYISKLGDFTHDVPQTEEQKARSNTNARILVSNPHTEPSSNDAPK